MKILHLLPPHENKKPGLNKTWCGRFVHEFEINDMATNCPQCLEKEKEYERNEV